MSSKKCLQWNTALQYTKCERVSEDGRTCYNPSIRYGQHLSYMKTGGYPTLHSSNNYKQWCQQLFPKKTIISASMTYYYSTGKPSNFVGALFWCSMYDESRPHWCDLKDGYWHAYNQPLGPYWYYGMNIINSLTCQY